VRISNFRPVALLCLFASAALAAEPRSPPRVPLHWLWNEKETDSAYTVSAERRAWLIRERGYADMGPIAYVHAEQVPNSRALKCFYAGGPRTNTFCSTSIFEQRLIRSMGYEEVSIEGYLQTEPATGNTVLYRVSRGYGDGRDREHRFVTSGDEVLRMRKQGWIYDGSKGFVYGSP
jgi:hypothetical protein